MLSVAHFISAAGAGGSGLGIEDPLVLGPIAAFIFTIFVTEIVVPGKAYKREVEENKRLRDLTEKVVPLAEQMVDGIKDMLRMSELTGRVLEDFQNFWKDERRR